MIKLLSILLVSLVLNIESHASIAFDSSSEPAYNDEATFNALNGGSGFNAWSVGGNGGSYINARTLGSSGFRLWADAGMFVVAERSLSSALETGQSFSVNIGHFGGNNGELGLSLMSGISSVFNLNLVAGSSYWRAWDGGSSYDLNDVSGMANYHTTDNDLAVFTFTFNGGNSYSFSLEDSLGNGYFASDYTAINDITSIDGISFYNNGQGGGKNFYFDQLSIIPEPATVGLLAFVGSSLIVARRRFGT